MRPKGGPRRAICFFCDADDRVYGLCIGVPRGKELVRLLEDAEELMVVASLANRNVSSEQKDGTEESEDDANEEMQGDDDLIGFLRDRTAARTIRHYRPLLTQINSDTSITDAAKCLVTAVQLDLAERFQLQTPIDGARLVSTQQHVESSRYWCDAILPCVVEKSFDDVWLELTEVIWSARPWQVKNGVESLTNWLDSQIDSKPVVLELESTEIPFLSLAMPLSDETETIATDKQKHAKVPSRKDDISLLLFESKVAHRTVDHAEMACLLKHQSRHHEARTNKIFNAQSVMPRWLVFESRTATPLALSAKSQNRLKGLVERWTSQP